MEEAQRALNEAKMKGEEESRIKELEAILAKEKQEAEEAAAIALKEKLEAEQAALALAKKLEEEAAKNKAKKPDLDMLEDFDKRFGGVIEPSGKVFQRKKTLSKH